MSATTALATVMVAWLAIGIVTGTTMGRRGHDGFTWLLLGATLGPLVVPLALSTWHRTGPTTGVAARAWPPEPGRRLPAVEGHLGGPRRHRRGRVGEPTVVELAAVVTVGVGQGVLERFLIVHPIEAPLDDLRISVRSPLAQALLGHQVGEEVDVAAPSGPYRCRIVAVQGPPVGPDGPPPTPRHDAVTEGRT